MLYQDDLEESSLHKPAGAEAPTRSEHRPDSGLAEFVISILVGIAALSVLTVLAQA